MRALMDILAEKEIPASIRDAGKPLAGHLASAEKVLAERGKAEAEAGKVTARIGKWKRDTNAQRLAVQGKLLEHAAKAGLPKSFADGYFPASTGKAKAKGEVKPVEPGDGKKKGEK